MRWEALSTTAGTGHGEGWSATPDGWWEAFYGSNRMRGVAENESAAQRAAQAWLQMCRHNARVSARANGWPDA